MSRSLVLLFFILNADEVSSTQANDVLTTTYLGKTSCSKALSGFGSGSESLDGDLATTISEFYQKALTNFDLSGSPEQTALPTTDELTPLLIAWSESARSKEEDHFTIRVIAVASLKLVFAQSLLRTNYTSVVQLFGIKPLLQEIFWYGIFGMRSFDWTTENPSIRNYLLHATRSGVRAFESAQVNPGYVFKFSPPEDPLRHLEFGNPRFLRGFTDDRQSSVWRKKLITEIPLQGLSHDEERSIIRRQAFLTRLDEILFDLAYSPSRPSPYTPAFKQYARTLVHLRSNRRQSHDTKLLPFSAHVLLSVLTGKSRQNFTHLHVKLSKVLAGELRPLAPESQDHLEFAIRDYLSSIGGTTLGVRILAYLNNSERTTFHSYSLTPYRQRARAKTTEIISYLKSSAHEGSPFDLILNLKGLKASPIRLANKPGLIAALEKLFPARLPTENLGVHVESIEELGIPDKHVDDFYRVAYYVLVNIGMIAHFQLADVLDAPERSPLGSGTIDTVAIPGEK